MIAAGEVDPTVSLIPAEVSQTADQLSVGGGRQGPPVCTLENVDDTSSLLATDNADRAPATAVEPRQYASRHV